MRSSTFTHHSPKISHFHFAQTSILFYKLSRLPKWDAMCDMVLFLGGGKWCNYTVTVGAVEKNPSANAGDVRDVGSLPGLGRSPGVRNSTPLQESCTENSMDRGTRGLQSMGSQRFGHN